MKDLISKVLIGGIVVYVLVDRMFVERFEPKKISEMNAQEVYAENKILSISMPEPNKAPTYEQLRERKEQLAQENPFIYSKVRGGGY